MNIKSILCLIGLWASILCHGQTGRLFTVDNELSSSMINSLFQDKNGIIWIATEDGLNKYDGAKFTIYKHDKENEHSLLNNYVRFLFEDSKGHCYVGTLSGLQSYDSATDQFTDIPLIQTNGEVAPTNVAYMMERKNGEILIGTAGLGVLRIVENNRKLEARQLDDFIPSKIVNLLHEDKRGNLWVSTGDKGLFCITPKKKSLNFLTELNTMRISLTSICEDSEGNIYVGTLGKGLFRHDINTGRFDAVPYPANPDLPIKSLYQPNSKEIYIGTDGNGMKLYDIQKKEIVESKLNVTTFDLNKSKIHSIMKDRTGNIWLGFFQKGVMLVPAVTNAFKYIGYKSAQKNSIGSSCIMAVCKDHTGTLWVGTDNDGLYKVNKNGEQVAHFAHTKDASSVPSTIMSIYEDSKHNIWLGSYMQGMAKLDPNTGHCQYVRQLAGDNPYSSNIRVYCFAEDNQENLWIGTMGAGLYRMNLNTGETTQYTEGNSPNNTKANVLPSLWITSLLHTQDNRLYIGTYNGLGCLDLNSMNFTSVFHSNKLFPNSVIYAIHEDKDGNIWIGTSEGLKFMNIGTQETHDYTIKDGLPGNVICAIVGDKNNNIWISTSYGLARFNPEHKNFISYYANDGLQGNEFSKGAVYVDTNGEIIFGGVNGVTYFNPSEITGTTPKPNIYITGFYIHDKSVKKGMKSGGKEILEGSVMEADRFQLSHNDNSFSIEFSTMEFGNPERITYQYAINDERWITLRPGINRVSFSDLAPGVYHFSVKAKDYMTFSDTKEITIIISPAWYASTWAECFYALTCLAIIYFIIMQIRHRYRIRQEILEHVHAEQINEAKLQFFINISHEIRTPMTLIISPLQKLMAADKDSERQRTYHAIYRNAERLLLLVNQLMDIRKIDKGQMNLKFQETEIVSFIHELYSNFEYQANAKKITLNFLPETDELFAYVDPKYFDKAILNVISNALKFTLENGEINIYLRTCHNSSASKPLQNYFEIVIEDNGIGINENEIGRIFDRFYQIRNNINNSGVGTGIGLHLTRSLVELHHGTIEVANNQDKKGCHFIIRLPLGKEHLAAEEIEEHTDNVLQLVHASAPVMTSDSIINDEENKIRSKSKYRVLVVEDDEEIRKYICHELSTDFHTSESINGKEALDKILKKAPDLIISDIMMPEMDGLTLCRKIRQNVTINHIPIILLTAKTSEEDNLEGLETGADAYVVKPFSIDILRKTVESIIKRRELLRNSFSGKQEQTDKVQRIEAKSPDEKLMERVMNVINAQLSNPNLSVEMIAGEVGISRVHLHRKLKELTNQSTRDFIRNIRLKQAAALLAEKRHNITEVATLTGFSNMTYFSTAFKELYGMTPTTYMEKHLDSSEEE